MGTVFFRVHESERDPVELNPGHGGASRFAFFGDPVVPVLYAGATAEVAVFESVFHDSVPGAVVRASQWRSRVLSTVVVRRPLRLARFHSDGLRKLGIHPRDLTDTPPTSYPRTVRWAEAAHDAGLDGCVWMSRQFNSGRAYVLFGDRVGGDALEALGSHPEQRVFALPRDEAWLADLANRIDVTLLLR